MRITSLCLLMILWVGNAVAGEVRGTPANKLYEWMSSEPEAAAAYILGVRDAIYSKEEHVVQVKCTEAKLAPIVGTIGVMMYDLAASSERFVGLRAYAVVESSIIAACGIPK